MKGRDEMSISTECLIALNAKPLDSNVFKHCSIARIIRYGKKFGVLMDVLYTDESTRRWILAPDGEWRGKKYYKGKAPVYWFDTREQANAAIKKARRL